MGTCVTYTGGEAYGSNDASEYGASPGKKGAFYLGFEGTKGEVEAEVAYVKDIIRRTGGMITSLEHTARFMSKYTIQWCGARVATGHEGPLTTYVPLERMRDFYDKLYGEILPKYGTGPLPGEEYSLDVGRYRIVAGRYFVPKGEKAWERYQGMLREIAELATGLGGSISTCHGVGIEHRDNIELEYDEVALDTMRAIKKVLDPDNIMNPGKKIPDKK
jgi:FAD/FMN-containing dehydrogenase